VSTELAPRGRGLNPPNARFGPWVPALAIRAAFVLLSVDLSTTVFSYGLWITLGIMLTAIAVGAPKLLAPWVLIVFYGGSLLWRAPSATDWRFFVLLAGLHLMHVLGSQMLVLPWRSRVQLRVAGAVLLRFAIIQVPCQAVSWAALTLFAPRGLVSISVPVVGVLGIVGLVALVLVLVGPMVRRSTSGAAVR
jgi:hypothetical protein